MVEEQEWGGIYDKQLFRDNEKHCEDLDRCFRCVGASSVTGSRSALLSPLVLTLCLAIASTRLETVCRRHAAFSNILYSLSPLAHSRSAYMATIVLYAPLTFPPIANYSCVLLAHWPLSQIDAMTAEKLIYKRDGMREMARLYAVSTLSLIHI